MEIGRTNLNVPMQLRVQLEGESVVVYIIADSIDPNRLSVKLDTLLWEMVEPLGFMGKYSPEAAEMLDAVKKVVDQRYRQVRKNLV
jgi:hypothetical protein